MAPHITIYSLVECTLSGQTTNTIQGIAKAGKCSSVKALRFPFAEFCDLKLILKNNMTEIEWNSIRNSLRMISPSGESVYNEIYYQFYYDSNTFPDYDMWVTIGRAEVMIPSDAIEGQIRSKDSYGNDPCPPHDTEH